MSSVSELESLAEQMFASPDPDARRQAQERLSALTRDDADITPLQALLSQSSNQYALMFVAQGVVTWLVANRKWMNIDQKRELIVQICGGCVRRICSAGAPRHVMMSVLSAFAKLTKLCFEKEPFLSDAPRWALQLLRDTAPGSGGGDGASVEFSNEAERVKLHQISLVLLSTIVNECSKYDSSKTQTYMTYTIHRRCSNNFRDECMLDIFTASLQELEGVNVSSPSLTEVVELVKDCMTYDFMAIMVDETEEAYSSQFPSSWSEVLLSERTRRVLWGQHATLPYPYCGTLLTGLSSLCGIRRTFFNSAEERVVYLNNTLSALIPAMQMGDGRLKVPEYVTELAEACFRFVPPFGYRDLRLSSVFSSWVATAQAISIDVFRIPFGEEGSFTTATTWVRYWDRLTTSRRIFVMSEEHEKDLELISPGLALAFFQSRVMASSPRQAESNMADPSAASGLSSTPPPPSSGSIDAFLEDNEDADAMIEAIVGQSEGFVNIVLLEQTRTMELLSEYVNREVGPSVLNSAGATAWLFYMAGCLVKHVLGSVEEQSIDACSSFFLYVVDCANHRHNTANAGGSQSLLYGSFVERALLHFLSAVQSVLSQHRLYDALDKVVTNVFQSRAQLIQLILNMTGHNIMRGVGSVANEQATIPLIRESMDLIGNACSDLPLNVLSELQLSLPPVVELPIAQSPLTYKLRTNLQIVLWRLTEKNVYSTETLLQFLQPTELCMQNSLSGCGVGADACYTAGWMRDLRGVARAMRDCGEGIGDLVEWYCDHAGTFYEVLRGPLRGNTMVTISFLRFMEALLEQCGSRYAMPCGPALSSCGLLLFKHICSSIQSIIEGCITDEQLMRVRSGAGIVDGAYETMMKPLALAISCLHKCIKGGFVPFGAMWFYNDDTYDAVLLGLLRMLGVFPLTYYKEYPKVAAAVLRLLSAVVEDNAFRPLTQLDAGELEQIVSLVVYLCEDIDTQTSTLANGLSFLAFIAGLIRDVKAISTNTVSPIVGAMASGTGSGGGTPPPSPMQLPSFYATPSGRLSGTPGRSGGGNGGNGSHHSRSNGAMSRSVRLSRAALARTLEPFSSLWERLLSVAMNVVVCQDRLVGASCAIVFPIIETHPPFWYQFVEHFVLNYPSRKQPGVREALSTLSNVSETQDRLTSDMYTLRQQMRNL